MQIGRISRFGLMEMSRQRLRPSLGESSQIVCPQCEGHGRMRSIESLSLSIIRVAEEHAMKENTGQVLVQAPVEIANFLLNEKRGALREIEKRHDAPIIIVADEALRTPHYEVTRVRENELGEETSRPSYQRNTPRKLPVHALTKAQLNIPAPAVTHVKHDQPAPIREEREETATAAPAFAKPSLAEPAPAAAGGVVGWLKRVFGGGSSETSNATLAEQTRQRNDRQRNDRGNDRNNGPRRDGRGGQQGQGRGNNGGGGQRRDEQRSAKPQNAQPAQAGQQQKPRNEQPQKQQQPPKQQNQPKQPKPQNEAGQNTGRPPRQPRNSDSPKQPRQENAAESAELIATSAAATAPAVIADVVIADANPASTVIVSDTSAPLASGTDGKETSSAQLAAANDSSEGEGSDTGDGTGRRRRGRRGGRRRRRGAGEAGAGNEAGGAEDFGDDEQPQIIIANGSQPEFDFDDEAPAARPAAAAQAPVAAVAAPVVVEQARHPAPVADLPEPVAAVPAPVVEAPQPIAASALPVETQPEPAVIVAPAIASVVAQEILKNDTLESFTIAETQAPAEATAPQAAPAVEAPATPAPIVAVEQPRPAPAVRPAVGNTGSLFFTADADTPSSVTRHLFEPTPVPQTAPAVEKSEEHDLPLLADNDEPADEGKNQGSERSA